MLTKEILCESESVEIGNRAPDFTLCNYNGQEWNLNDQRGKVIALLFYPQNETLVCTRQMCSVKDYWQEYLDTKAVIVGISPNTVKSHLNFSQKYQLPLPILADEKKEVTSLYCQHWILPVNFTRAIIIIDANGIIRSRKIMLRAVRPTDRSVITAIHSARADALYKSYTSITKKFQAIKDYRL